MSACPPSPTQEPTRQLINIELLRRLREALGIDPEAGPVVVIGFNGEGVPVVGRPEGVKEFLEIEPYRVAGQLDNINVQSVTPASITVFTGRSVCTYCVIDGIAQLVCWG